MHGKRIPWSEGYHIYKRKFLIQTLSDKNLLERFRRGEHLPIGYVLGIDERCVEYPWLLAHLLDKPEVLLDAGSALNYDFILDQPSFKSKSIYILTLKPEWNCFWQKGISYLFQDLRDIPIRDAYYDTIACLSTLEHIGCDNTFFTDDESHCENRPKDFLLVMQELRRVLKPGGSLFLTVPFGSYCHMGALQQFDRNLLSLALETFGKVSEVAERFYRYSSKGWDVSNAMDCSECQYVESSVSKWTKQKCANDPQMESDSAAAARAVACIRLIKAE
jgi:SAM-dependent methyltransferase